VKLNLIAKYGTLITSAILLLIGVMTWFIKYPETVTTKSKLTGTNAPKPIIPKQNLRLAHLLISNNEEVQTGEVIGILETTADYKEILEFEKLLNDLEQNISNNNTTTIKNLMQKPFQHLGELQS